MDPQARQLSQLKNLGEKTASWLVDAGIVELEQLRNLGAIESMKRVILAGYPANLLFVYAIEGALTDQNMNKIDSQRKSELRQLYQEMRQDIGR